MLPPDPGPFALSCDELSQRFVIASKSTTRWLAYPITTLGYDRADWRNRKKPPMELWKSITTPQERADVRLLCKSSEMHEILREVDRMVQNPDNNALHDKIRVILEYIEKEPE